MSNKNKNILVAISGGVDSSVTAALLLQQQHNCTGVFMITSDASHHCQKDAQAVADKLSIKLHILDLRKDFEQILEYFCSEYQKGRTPNPCVLCNRLIKFGSLWQFAQSIGCPGSGLALKVCRKPHSQPAKESNDHLEGITLRRQISILYGIP